MTAYRFRCVQVLFFAIVWSALSIAPVFAASQIVGSTTNPGDVQVTVDDLGSVRFQSNDAGVIQDQWLCPGVDPSNGVVIGFNDGSAKKFRTRFFTAGTVVTPISNSLTGRTVTTVYRLGTADTDPLVTQFVFLDTNNRLYDIWWTIEVPSGGTSITSLQLVYGGDTNLLGDDNGFGTWKADTSTVSVHPDPDAGSGNMSLEGVTVPTAYNALNFSAIRTNGNALALTSTVSATTVDIGMAMQWDIGSLAAGSSVTIRSTVSLSTTFDLATPTPAAGTPSATPVFTRTSTPTSTSTATPTSTSTHTPTTSPSATTTETPTNTPSATATASPSPTPTVPPSSTPTVTPTPTETGTTTPTSTFTVTPTVSTTPTSTVTGTPTYNSTPDPGIGSVSPPVFDKPPGGATSEQRPTFTGVAPAESSVQIVIDGVPVGNAAVGRDEKFSFKVPAPLAVGDREVKGKTVLSNGTESEYSIPIILTIRREAVLDFDGDGITDGTGHIVQGNRVMYRSVLSGSQSVISEVVNGWFPAPADYDGDGAWDYAAVGVLAGALRWSVQPSGSQAASVVPFGKSGDIALVGCRFGVGGEYVLAVRRGRHVRFRTLSGNFQGAFSVKASDVRQVLGCGDIDGDGVDELLVSARKTRRLDRVTAVTTKGARRHVTNVSRFINGFIARDVASGAPVLGALRGSGRDSKASELRALRGTFEFPMVLLPSSLDVASGTFLRADGSSLTTGIMWQRRGTLDVLRMLAHESYPSKVLRLFKGYRVTKPQDSRRVAATRRGDRKRAVR